jgi:hypothetical protein
MAQNPLYGLDRTAERIRLVHEAALRAAARIRLDADRIRTLAGADSPNGSIEPGDSGDTSRPSLGRAAAMADLADVVADRTEAISRDYAELSRMLDGALGAGGRFMPTAQQTGDPTEEADPVLASLEEVEAATPVPPKRRFWQRRWFAARSRQDANEDLKLVAAEMAIAGSTRAEIEERLGSAFGPDEAAQALGEIFTDGTQGGGSR